jgi:hypothetical protein
VLETAALAGIIILHHLATVWVGRRGFTSCDMSLIADGGYRIFLGQVPYRDFHIPVGPFVFYLQAGFFALAGGFSWNALVLHAAVIGALAILIIHSVLRLYLPWLVAFVFTAVSALTFYLPMAFPWHDHTALFFFLIAIATFCHAQKAASRGWRLVVRLAAGACGLALTAALFSKHNIGITSLLTLGLWIAIPLSERDSFRSRLVRAGICVFSLLASTALLCCYFETQGNFLADIASSAGQTARWQRLLSAALILRFPYSLDLWVIAAVALLYCLAWLQGWDATPPQRALLASAITVLAVTFVARNTGAGIPVMFGSLLSLALGMLYAALRETGNVHWPLEVLRGRGEKLAKAFAAAGLALFLLAVASLIRLSRDAFETLLSGRGGANFIVYVAALVVGSAACLAAFLLFRQRIRREPDSPERFTIDLVVPCRAAIVLITLLLGAFYVKYDRSRSVWTDYAPEMRGSLVRFSGFPALEGLYGREEMVRDYEELVTWLGPRIASDKSLRDGSEILIFPSGQMLYGILGVESFRGVHLWYHYRLTFTKLDPDTQVIERVRPRYIILERDGLDYKFYGREGSPTSQFERMPALKSLLQSSYTTAAQLHGFEILERRSR